MEANTLAAADIDMSSSLFNGILIGYAVCGIILILLAAIGGKASAGKRWTLGVVGAIILAIVSGYVIFDWHTMWIPSGKGFLCVTIGPIALIIWGIVGLFKADGHDSSIPPTQPPNAQQWNAANPQAQQWGAPQQAPPQQWGQQPPPPQYPPQQYPPQAYPQQQPYPPQYPQQQPPPQQWGQQPPPPPR
ncbi:hypothetical protein Afil01_52460 [Actinorhabdospora filicis]|uniref:Uncharacterized protein n=1 Tax=Actinorhabdospora filicis TaxID=1785913 RepID=A0A9W6SR28_9ACTN|nr:hypothetical protein [Actinorhabdospora filicis]GLZ80439.1 hypothetical protein Afil01_52460 [Actinorhabdospora filicis]